MSEEAYERDGLYFRLDEKASILTVTLNPEEFWPTIRANRLQPGDIFDGHDGKIARRCLRVIADESTRLRYIGHTTFEIRLETVHMGANAMDRAVQENK